MESHASADLEQRAAEWACELLGEDRPRSVRGENSGSSARGRAFAGHHPHRRRRRRLRARELRLQKPDPRTDLARQGAPRRHDVRERRALQAPGELREAPHVHAPHGLVHGEAAAFHALRDAALKGQTTSLADLNTGVGDFIISLFDQLNAAEKMVLKSAAVIGFYFSTTCLRHVLDEVAPGLSLTLDAALIGLIQANFVASQRRDAGGGASGSTSGRLCFGLFAPPFFPSSNMPRRR